MPTRARLTLPWLFAGCLWAAALQAQATEQVYRCGQSYQAELCPSGQAVAVGDARDEAARREAQRVAQREAKAAQQMQTERLKRERGQTPDQTAQVAVVRHRAAEAAASTPSAPPAVTPQCRRKSGLRSPSVGGCRDEMVYNAPGSAPPPKSKAGRRKTPKSA